MSQRPRRWLILPGLATGIGVLLLAAASRGGAERAEASNAALPVAVAVVEERPFAPEIRGFGRARPQVEWKAVAEVGGRIIFRDERLRTGALLERGTLLLRIDPLDYELRLAQAQADLASAEAELARLELQQQNIETGLEIDRRDLRLGEQELARKGELRRQGLVSQSDYDREQRNVLAQRKRVQEQENSLRLLEADRAVRSAQRRVAEARVAEAVRDLERTRIELPIDARVARVAVERDQVASPGQVLVEAHGIETMEVEAQVALRDMRRLVALLPDDLATDGDLPDIGRLALPAEVVARTADEVVRWPARVARISGTIDEVRATVGVILEIDQDYRNLDVQRGPPLVNGLFVEALIRGLEAPFRLIPERALHGDRLYRVDADRRLELVAVRTLFRRDGRAAVTGVAPGDRVVLTDIVPPVAGIALDIVD